MVMRLRLPSLKGRGPLLPDPAHPRKPCENCGAKNDPKNRFCGSCGAPMASRVVNSDDQSLDGASGPGNRSSPLGDLSVDRIRSLSAEPTREAILGGLLAVGVALVQIVGLYVLLLIRWAVGASDAPGSCQRLLDASTPPRKVVSNTDSPLSLSHCPPARAQAAPRRRWCQGGVN
jgi:hypothetical protein